MSDCLFCKIRDGEIPAATVFSDEQVVVFRDVSPRAPTHLLVIPRKHIRSLAEAGAEDAALIGHMNVVAARVAREAGLDSFRVVVNSGAGAGQSVWHLHLHVLGGRPLAWPPG
jgi:histidine triad (HIT) family protein